MKMTEDDILNATEINFQLARILEDRVRPRTRIVEDLVAIGFDQRRESPFPDAVVRQHRRKDCDLQVAHFRGGFCSRSVGRSLRERCCCSKIQRYCQEKDSTRESHGFSFDTFMLYPSIRRTVAQREEHRHRHALATMRRLC